MMLHRPKWIAWTAGLAVTGILSFTTLAAQPQGGPIAALQSALAALQNQVGSLATAVANLQNQSSGGGEFWRVGTPSGGGGGPLTAGNVFFCSFFCPPSVVNAFDTLPPEARRVETVRLVVSNRSGNYGPGLWLTVEVRSFDGSSSRVLSTEPIDLETAPALQWIIVPIADTDDAIVHPGEYLASRVVLGGPQGGNLALNLHLRADVAAP